LLGCLTKIVPINFGGIEPCNWPAALPVQKERPRYLSSPYPEVQVEALKAVATGHATII